jgi:hypothetical protein
MSARGFLYCRRHRGLVGLAYRGGGSPHLIKVKNRTDPAMERVKYAFQRQN